MGSDTIQGLETQIKTLRKKLNLSYLAIIVCFIIAILFAIRRPKTSTDSHGDIIYAKGLVILDNKGRNRIVLGSPVPDPVEGKRSSPETGIIINDSLGLERFGVGLGATGRMVFGLDAPKDQGDNRNRERITMVADENGSAYLRFLDRQTFAAGLLQLDDSNFFSLKFPKVEDNKIKIRQYSFKGEQKFEMENH
jgi:hypothetical protein